MLAYIECQTIPALLVKSNIGFFEPIKSGIKLISDIAGISSYTDEAQYPRGMKAIDVYNLSSPESKEITKRIGADRNIYVLATDPRLKYFLANYRDPKYQKYDDIKPETMPYGKQQYNTYSGTIARSTLGISREKWGQLATYLSMTDYYASASVEIIEGDDGYKVIYLRPASTPALFQDSDLPYSTPLEQVNQWSLTHELAHSWDTELYPREHNSAALNTHHSISEDDAGLIAESIADLTTALVMLKVTENDDTLKYQILPFRTRSGGDHIHATQYLLGKTYNKFSIADVINKTDLELSYLAISAINQEVLNNFEEMEQFISNHKYNYRLLIAAEVTRLKILPGWISDAKQNSRTALENSIKNTVYQGDFGGKCKTLRSAIEAHNKYYNDAVLTAALESAPHLCDNDEYNQPALAKFSRDSGFIIDWTSHDRLAENVKKIDTYYQKLTNHRSDFDTH
jgi:hypothetical protein